MAFVYIHMLWFVVWIGFRVEKYPFGLLTMIVSLEAIFLSTFVMISQNRADAKRQVLADHQWEIVQTEEKQNEDLLDISKQILELTQAIHELTTKSAGAAGYAAGQCARVTRYTTCPGPRSIGRTRTRRGRVACAGAAARASSFVRRDAV